MAWEEERQTTFHLVLSPGLVLDPTANPGSAYSIIVLQIEKKNNPSSTLTPGLPSLHPPMAPPFVRFKSPWTCPINSCVFQAWCTM